MRRVEILCFALMEVIIKINIKLNHHPLSLFATTDGLLLYCLIYKKTKPNRLLSKDAATDIASLYRDDISVTQITLARSLICLFRFCC